MTKDPAGATSTPGAPTPGQPTSGQPTPALTLDAVVRVSREVAGTRSRKAKTAHLAAALTTADPSGEPSGEPSEVEILASYLSGAPRQRRTGLGWRALADLPRPAETSTLTLREVDAALQSLAMLSGPGSQQARREAFLALFGHATADEQAFLRDLISGNLRQGALDALLLEAIAQAADVPITRVRRAATFTPRSGEVARAALSGGVEALAAFALVPGRPVRPMLASSAPEVATAVATLVARDGAPVLVDRKIDGIRVQAHRTEEGVRLFTRSLEEVTERLPEVVEVVRALPARSVVLDGEAIALRPDGRPRPFQETGSRTASTQDVEVLRSRVPLTAYFFDLLEHDGTDLMDCPARERLAALRGLVPADLLLPHVETDAPEEALAFFEDNVSQGHEGVVVKSLAAPYAAGRRGSDWVKVKPRHTLDLVVLAVEWGSGRRRGTLSNIHLGARDVDGGLVMLGMTSKDPYEPGWAMVGKTFKGMSDEILAWQTERFLELETHRDGHVIYLRPEQVVEIALDGVQRSSRYRSGAALRFARVVRYRDDKTADEADTIASVRGLLSP